MYNHVFFKNISRHIILYLYNFVVFQSQMKSFPSASPEITYLYNAVNTQSDKHAMKSSTVERAQNTA